MNDKPSMHASPAPKDAREALSMGRDLKATAGNPENFEKFHPAESSQDEAGANPITARRLAELVRPIPGDRTELIRHRFLCRGGGALLIGPTGVGKSSLLMQLMISFAVGKACFGIQPNGPLRCLLVQAENDDGDLAEMRDGVLGALDLPASEHALFAQNIVVASVDDRSGETFQAVLASLIKENRPDLVLLDPALAYIAGDSNSARDVGQFLRGMINPLLHEHDCGAIIVHHTPKPPGTPATSQKATAYAGAGSAEWANWARAVLILEPGGKGRCKLHAAKRGGRLKWTAGDGTRAFYKLIEHTLVPDGFAWEEVPEAEQARDAGLRKACEVPDLLAHVPGGEGIEKQTLIHKAQSAGMGEKTARRLIDVALAEGSLHARKAKRSGTNAATWLSLQPWSTASEAATTAA